MSWARCRTLTASVLPVRSACDLRCRFCFSASSISALERAQHDLRRLDLEAYYRRARRRGARRLVVTGGGEPLLRPDVALECIARGKAFFDEIALFTNGTHLTPELSAALAEAGLSYLCWSRHHWDDAHNRDLMRGPAPSIPSFFAAAGGLKVRATCVMARGFVDSEQGARTYIETLLPHGVREFTFKHTYVSHADSVLTRSSQNTWAAGHRVAADPFEGRGEPVARLPWGPVIRRVGTAQLCFYFEPTPAWELENGLCRSLNLLSDGSVYASLEDQSSLLYRLGCSSAPRTPSASSGTAPSCP